jgi:hypothetical protein
MLDASLSPAGDLARAMAEKRHAQKAELLYIR